MKHDFVNRSLLSVLSLSLLSVMQSLSTLEPGIRCHGFVIRSSIQVQCLRACISYTYLPDYTRYHLWWGKKSEPTTEKLFYLPMQFGQILFLKVLASCCRIQCVLLTFLIITMYLNAVNFTGIFI